MGAPVNDVPLHANVRGSVHLDGVQLAPSVREALGPECSQAHLPTSAPSRAQPFSGWYPASYATAVDGGVDHTAAGFLLPFGHRHSLLGHPVPPRSSAPLTIGLPAIRADGFDARLDHDGVSTFHSLELRPGWVPSLPRDHVVLSWPVSCLRPPRAPSARGKVLSPRSPSHLPGLPITRRHQGFTHVHPPGLLPGLVTPGWIGGSLGKSSRASHLADQEPATHAGAGDGRSSTCPELCHLHHQSSNPHSSLKVSDWCRTTRFGSSKTGVTV